MATNMPAIAPSLLISPKTTLSDTMRVGHEAEYKVRGSVHVQR